MKSSKQDCQCSFRNSSVNHFELNLHDCSRPRKPFATIIYWYHPIISWRWWVHSFQTFCLFHCSFWTLQALLPPLKGVLRCPREGTWNIVWKGRRPGWRAFARNIRFYFLLLFFKIRSYIFGIEQDVRAKILEGVYKSLLLKPRLKVLLTFLVHDLI